MEKNYRIKESKHGYFYIEEKIELLYFEYSYFEYLLLCLFGIKKTFWRDNSCKQFKTIEEATDYIKK